MPSRSSLAVSVNFILAGTIFGFLYVPLCLSEKIWHTNMPFSSFLAESSVNFLLVGTIFSFLYVPLWLSEKICHQDKQIKYLFSRLKNCEKKSQSLKQQLLPAKLLALAGLRKRSRTRTSPPTLAAT